ncbi:MAG: 4Fe-4S dicluster domain-containing protein [Peptococcaceae bacterium]|nr:4Fe-4S dicluster domain-containing protein [Peptococcaceae bacterium]
MENLFQNQSFAMEVRKKSGQPIELCYQCQKCASGCSMARYTDYTPNQILRFVQLGMKEKVLNSSMIWICSSCEICGARCPNEIKMAEVMDVLKHMAISENIIKEKNIYTFNDIFLNTVKSRGRIHELTMMSLYKLKTRDLFSDVEHGIKLFLKGKLPLLSRGIRNRKLLKDIFNRSIDSVNKDNFVKCSN